MMRRIAAYWCLFAAPVLVSVSAATQSAQDSCAPLEEQLVRDTVRTRSLHTVLLSRITRCGVAFITDGDVEKRLREAGATDQIIAALKPPPGNPALGQKWTPPIDKREMVWIAAGEARIGSPAEEPDHRDDEGRHTVRIDRGFWLDSTEVTNDAYRRFVLAKPEWQKAKA